VAQPGRTNGGLSPRHLVIVWYRVYAVPECRWRAEDYAEFRGYSAAELGRHKLGTRRPPARRSADLFAVKSRPRAGRQLPAEFDARRHWPGWISAPTDQGGCGASWAFSTASQSPRRRRLARHTKLCFRPSLAKPTFHNGYWPLVVWRRSVPNIVTVQPFQLVFPYFPSPFLFPRISSPPLPCQCGLVVRATERSQVRSPAVPLSGNNLGQVVHTHVPLSPSSKFGTGQGSVMPCGWEGNRRSGVALAMRRRLLWFIHRRVQGLTKGDEHPAYTPYGVWHT